MTPASRGTSRLSSADPDAAPVIDPRYLQVPADVARIVAGLRLAREVGGSSALTSLREAEVFPGPDADSDAAIHDYLRRR
jgi:choline dehydrogenase